MNYLTRAGESVRGVFWGVVLAPDLRRDPDGKLGLEYVKRIGIREPSTGAIYMFTVTLSIKQSFGPWGDLDTGILRFRQRYLDREVWVEAVCVKDEIPRNPDGSGGAPPEVEIHFTDETIEEALHG